MLLLIAAITVVRLHAPHELAGAAVLLDGQRVATLDAKAQATFNANRPGAHVIVVRAPRYDDEVKHFHAAADAVTIRVSPAHKIAGAGECRCIRLGETYMQPFLGRVTKTEPVTIAAEPGETLTRVTFEVEHSWMGKLPRRVSVLTWAVGGRYCGFPFSPHQRYLVYPWGLRGTLFTDECTRTRLAADAVEDIDALNVSEITVEPKRAEHKLTERERDLIAFVLRHPPDYAATCDSERQAKLPLLIGDSSTARVRFGRDAEDVRMELEKSGPWDVANAAPDLIAALIERNDRERAALVRQTRRAPFVSISLPVFDDATGLAAIQVITNCEYSPLLSAYIFLKSDRDAWRIVAWHQ